MTALILALMTATATIPDDLMLDSIAAQHLIMEQMVDVTDALERIETRQHQMIAGIAGIGSAPAAQPQTQNAELARDSIAWVYFSVTGRRMPTDATTNPDELSVYCRASHMRLIAQGAEGQAAVKRLYREILQREADPVGLSHYQEELASGRLNYWGLCDRMLRSDEAKKKGAQYLENGRKYLAERKKKKS